jgi:HD-GYP domain-containing protein (c-di-GMP phosphodiesterase class II)
MIPRTQWEVVVTDTIAELAAGLTTIGLYGVEHPRAEQAVERLIGHLATLFEDERELSFVLLGDELFVGERPFTRSSRQAPALIRRFRRRNLEHITFRAGLAAEELRSFLDDMARSEEGAVRSRPHIQVGRLEFSETEAGGPDERDGGLAGKRLSTIRSRVSVIDDAFAACLAGGEVPTSTLERVVKAMLDNLSKDPDPLKQFAPWEGEARWPAVHAHNVCALTVGVARLANVSAPWCVDLGIAAILHDIGKLMLPDEVQERELELHGDELELMLDHPKLALDVLLPTRQLTPLAPIVAFEHHLNYNGTGFPRLSRPRRPHPATRLIAVADMFVILHTLRGSRGMATRESAIAWLTEHSWTLLDPGWSEIVATLVISQPEPGAG